MRKEIDELAKVVFWFCVGGWFVGLITFGIMQSRSQHEAISAGVAEWRIDPTTGEREFVYLTPAEIAARLEQP